MTSEGENIYAVVLFFPRNESDNLIDLIPSSWIFTDVNGVVCRYPGPDSYKKLPHWVAVLREPKKDWPQFDVEVLAYARTLKQGKRRLKRACTNLEVRNSNTGCENVSLNARPVILNNSDFEKELENMPILIDRPVTNEVENIAPNNGEEEILARSTLEESTTTHGTEESSPEIIPLNNDDLIPETLKAYLDEKFKKVLAAIKSAKRSILYDVEKKTNDIKLAILNNMMATSNNSLNDTQTELGVVFPIQTIQDFLSFEEAIATSEGKKKALIKWNRILVFGETCIKKCVKKIMIATLSKTVETEYSAFGRQIHGKGKRNFSETQTYSCLNDVLLEKFECREYKQLNSVLSRWLSGAGDREGGRKRRRCICVVAES
ncbi:uncharacterized protein [Temnothorax nylanderi]|uniref:uncharacterized protein n=1 Tax=Temnothorax nylanderi TaxID=102681 RepID=UPI003A863883